MRLRHAIPLLVLAGLVLALDLAAWRLAPLQPPSPGPRERQQEQLDQTNSQEEQRKTSVSPTEYALTQYGYYQEAKPPQDWWLIPIVQLVAAAVTAGATWFIASYTMRLSEISEEQAKILVDTLSTNREIERAYIHTSCAPPGLIFDAPTGSLPGRSRHRKPG